MRDFNSAHKKIEMFIGAWGVKTGDIPNGAHLLELASRLFEIENSGIESDMASKIDALGRKERKRLAEKNLPTVFGSKPHEKVLPPPSTGISEAQLERMMAVSEPKLIDGNDLDRSCPVAWCSFFQPPVRSGLGRRESQRATAGRLMRGSSLI